MDNVDDQAQCQGRLVFYIHKKWEEESRQKIGKAMKIEKKKRNLRKEENKQKKTEIGMVKVMYWENNFPRDILS